MKQLIVLALGVLATSALAQTSPSPALPDAGFFRPADLAVPKVPADATLPNAPANAPARADAQAQAQPQPAAPDPADEIRKAEEARKAEDQMDRIERENERARPQAPVTINGAFTGLTDERNR